MPRRSSKSEAGLIISVFIFSKIFIIYYHAISKFANCASLPCFVHCAYKSSDAQTTIDFLVHRSIMHNYMKINNKVNNNVGVN